MRGVPERVEGDRVLVAAAHVLDEMAALAELADARGLDPAKTAGVARDLREFRGRINEVRRRADSGYFEERPSEATA